MTPPGVGALGLHRRPHRQIPLQPPHRSKARHPRRRGAGPAPAPGGGRLRTLVAVGNGDIHLDFYRPTIADPDAGRALAYPLDVTGGLMQADWRVGLHVGLDVARSRDTTAFYIIVGNAWFRP